MFAVRHLPYKEISMLINRLKSTKRFTYGHGRKREKTCVRVKNEKHTVDIGRLSHEAHSNEQLKLFS